MNTAWENIGTLVRRRRAGNPGPMTLEGTNSYVLAAPGATGVVVVDPGPLLEDHLADLAGAGAVELILVTHRHGDHTDGSARLHELTGAPVRAALPAFCHNGSTLSDGELIHAAGLTIEVFATPGHTSDSLCFAVSASSPADGHPERLVLTGDTILGSGTTVICYPDGTLGDYLNSLDRLKKWGSGNTDAGVSVKALPGHGPVLEDLAEVAQRYQAHRAERIAQVRAAVEHLQQGTEEFPTVEAVTNTVYGDIPENLQGAAQLSVQAQLHYLRG